MENISAIKPSRTNRHVGIELLRIVSMLMVVALHSLIKGNYNKTQNFLINNECWVMICLSVVAVNCYVLISGYFLCESHFKLRRAANTFTQMWFYSVATLAVMVAFKIYKFKFGDFFWAVFPFRGTHWFAETYLQLLFVSPILNFAISNMKKKQMKLSLVSLLGIYCVLNFLFKYFNPIDDSGGYGIIWFICLYFVAAYLKKYYKITGKSGKYFLGYFITVLLNSILHFIFRNSNEVLREWMIRDYNNILVLIGSVFLFLAFLNMNIKSNAAKKIITFISPLTFGVYLIHESQYVSDFLWSRINADTIKPNGINFAFIAVGIILAVFTVCAIIEFVRQKLFKLIKIDDLINSVSDKIERKIRKLVKEN